MCQTLYCQAFLEMLSLRRFIKARRIFVVLSWKLEVLRDQADFQSWAFSLSSCKGCVMGSTHVYEEEAVEIFILFVLAKHDLLHWEYFLHETFCHGIKIQKRQDQPPCLNKWAALQVSWELLFWRNTLYIGWNYLCSMPLCKLVLLKSDPVPFFIYS